MWNFPNVFSDSWKGVKAKCFKKHMELIIWFQHLFRKSTCIPRPPHNCGQFNNTHFSWIPQCLITHISSLKLHSGLGFLLSFKSLKHSRSPCFGFVFWKQRKNDLLVYFWNLQSNFEVPGGFSVWKGEFGGLRLTLSPQITVHIYKSKPGIPSCFSLEVGLTLFIFCLGSLPLRCFKSKTQRPKTKKAKPDSRKKWPSTLGSLLQRQKVTSRVP